MEYTTYASRLRFLGAGDVDARVVDYDGLDVKGPADEALGRVDGFIVDPDAGRVHYVVVDSGGWFRSRRLLLPIGHAALDSERGALRVEVSKQALSRFPEFDEDRFRQFSDEDLRTFERHLEQACCPETKGTAESWAPGSGRHFAQPAWWDDSSYARERLLPVLPPKPVEIS